MISHFWAQTQAASVFSKAARGSLCAARVEGHCSKEVVLSGAGGQFCSPGQIWQDLQILLIVIMRGSATIVKCVEARDAAQYPAMHRKAAPQEPSSSKCQ